MLLKTQPDLLYCVNIRLIYSMQTQMKDIFSSNRGGHYCIPQKIVSRTEEEKYPQDKAQKQCGLFQ